MDFSPHQEVRIKATICKADGNKSFHIQTVDDNYAECFLVEVEGTGEIRAYRKSALEYIEG